MGLDVRVRTAAEAGPARSAIIMRSSVGKPSMQLFPGAGPRSRAAVSVDFAPFGGWVSIVAMSERESMMLSF
jgi:hypothetical protein